MANSVQGLIKSTNNQNSTQQFFGGNTFEAQDGSPVKLIRSGEGADIQEVTAHLVKNPGDGSESVLQKATVTEADWAASDTAKEIFEWTDGVEGDNGSTAGKISWSLPVADMTGAANVYGIRIFIRGHGEMLFIATFTSSFVRCEPNSSGRYEADLFLSNGSI